MRVRRRALAALLATVAVAACAAAGPPRAADAPQRAVSEPTPAEARGGGRRPGRAPWPTRPARSRAPLAAPPAPRREASLTDDEVTAIARTSAELARLGRGPHDLPHRGQTTTPRRASTPTSRSARTTTGKETVEAQVLVADDSGQITEVRTGPQVAWMMARGYDGAFGRAINRPAIWLWLCAIFLSPLLPLTPPAPAAVVAHARPAGAAVVRRLADLVQPRRDLHLGAAAVPADGLPRRSGWPGSRSPGCARRARAPEEAPASRAGPRAGAPDLRRVGAHVGAGDAARRRRSPCASGSTPSTPT